jgi:DNA mismatch repair protein MutS
VLKEHESAEHTLTGHVAKDTTPVSNVQLTMFTPLSQQVVDRLRAADLNALTPIEAMNLLYELKKQVD